MIEIDRVIFPIRTLGPGKRVVIWTVGCPRRCHNCSNSELQQEGQGKLASIKGIVESLRGRRNEIEGVTITGGDPFLQAEPLEKLVELLKENISGDILIYTGYTLEELREIKSDSINNILNNISVLIDGPYVEELNDNKGIRGSNNQRVHIMNPSYEHLYEGAEYCVREVENIFYSNNVIHAGIPLRSNETFVLEE